MSKGNTGVLHNSANYNIKQKINDKAFYGPFESIQLSNTMKNRHNAQVSGRSITNEKPLINEKDLTSEKHYTTTQKVVSRKFPSVPNNFQEKESSNRWNPVTHWTLQEYHPYNSYSYHYHKVMYPKNKS